MRYLCRRRTRDKGAVTFLSLFLVLVLAGLTVALATASLLEIRKADNSADVVRARLAAESGISYMRNEMDTLRLPNGTTAETLMAALYQALSARLSGTGTLAGASVSLVNGQIVVPEVSLPQASFSCRFALEPNSSPPACRLTVTGRCGEVTRPLAIGVVSGRERGACSTTASPRGARSTSAAAPWCAE